MGNFNDKLTAWRASNQTGSILSKLTIDNTLYNIKDPALSYLATELDTKITYLETQITAANDKVVAAADVTFTKGDNFTAENVQAAIEEALSKAMALKGASTDESSYETIAAAKKYADEKVQQLAGQDWTTQAQKVSDIIKELEGTDAGNWATLADKLDNMIVADETATGGQREATSVAEYVSYEIARVNAANADGINSLDAVVYGADGAVGKTGAEADTAFSGDTTNKVAVKISEVDGKITQVDVKTNDIASAQALTTLDTAVVKKVNNVTPTNNEVTLTGTNIAVSSSDTTKLDAKIVDLTNQINSKANKAAIGSDSINNWSTQYDSTNEKLIWTSAAKAVYVPVTNQSL